MAAAKKPAAKKVVAKKKPAAKKVIAKKPAAKKVVAVKPSGVKKPRAKKVKEPVVSQNDLDKARATANSEPWVAILNVDLDPANISSGSFDLDFNDHFVAKLIRAGYKGKTDYDIVDQWFTDICRNVLQENWEQDQADPTNRGRD